MGGEQQTEGIGVGTVIRTHKWGDVVSGTVVNRQGDTLVIAWHNSFVEGELHVSEVELWPDAPVALRAWRGGGGVFGSQGIEKIEPLPPSSSERSL